MNASVVSSIRQFKERRDDLLHGDASAFDHHLERFLAFLRVDPLAVQAVASLSIPNNVDDWWESAKAGSLDFPEDQDLETSLRYSILQSVNENTRRLWALAHPFNKSKTDDIIELFRDIVVRPFLNDLSHRIGEIAELASPEARMIQAVPLSRIPPPGKSRVFISHRGLDKVLAQRYHLVLQELGYDPWLDDPELFAGSNLERAIKQGFVDSCAAIFLITEHFADDNFLSTEIDYAIQEKRKKGNKFVIISLRYEGSSAIPSLLETYTYKNIKNDLDGLYEVVRALPIELGPVRWRDNLSE